MTYDLIMSGPCSLLFSIFYFSFFFVYAAEYGFSERDLESTKSNLLCVEGPRSLNENATKKRSSKAQHSLVLEVDLADRKNEQNLLGDVVKNTVHNDQTETTIQIKKHVHDESQTLKIAIDNLYDKDDSVPEEMASTQSSPSFMYNAVSKKRLKRSIQRVNEWLQKTSEVLNATPWDEELLSEVFPELDDELSDNGSSVSTETEIMTAFCPSALLETVEKGNVHDKIFGKVYKREKKSNLVTKKTVVANVHVDGVADSEKRNKMPKWLSNCVQPEDFIRIETMEENSNADDKDTLVANNHIINSDENESNQHLRCLKNDESNAPETKSKTQNKSRKRKSESSLNTLPVQSPLLVTKSELAKDKHSPSHLPENKIGTDPSSMETEDNQTNVRRSRRLNMLSKKVETSSNQKPAGASAKKIRNTEPACNDPNTERIVQSKQLHYSAVIESEDQIISSLTHKGKERQFVTDVEIHPIHLDYETSQLTDLGGKECCNMPDEAVSNVLNSEDIDTQHLMKAFKSAKRMSFKLDTITGTENKEQLNPLNQSNTKTQLQNKYQAQIALPASDNKEQVIHTNEATHSNDNKSSKFNADSEAVQQNGHNRAGHVDLNPVNKPHEDGSQESISDISKSEVLVLCSENDTRLHPIITYQSPSSVRREDNRSVTAQGENEQVKKDCYRKPSFYEEQVNQITSDNGSQGSVTQKQQEHSVSHRSSLEVYSDTPDGLVCIADGPGEEQNVCAEAEKSFVFAKEEEVGGFDSSKSPNNESQLVKRKKRRTRKLESSEEESSEDEELPSFNQLFGNTLSSAGQKRVSSELSSGAGGLNMSSGMFNSTNGNKTQTSLNFPGETLPGSQEQVEKKDNETADNNCEDTCLEQNLDEGSECASEASHTGDSSGLSSQCEMFNTQQRDALRNNLQKLQEEMAALEAVLEQQSTQSPSSEKEQASTAELNTRRLQVACQKQTDHETDISPDTVPETGMQSPWSVEQPVQIDIRLRSPTPPLSQPQTRSTKQTRSTFILLKELKENSLTQEECKESDNMEESSECSPFTKEPDTCKPPEAVLNKATASPRRSLRNTTLSNKEINTSSAYNGRNSAVSKQQSQQFKTNIDGNRRSSSPVFTSPARSKRGSTTSKIPVIANKRNFSLVASGLSHSELILVQKFAKKTQSIFSGEISESTTHIIMKTDEYLVCERTLKYFLGIAGRKWVVSYDWIVQSFREGRILDEYDFEVRGDVINGRNHRGPRRSRLGSDGLLLSDFEICCLGNFKDMTQESLEWMVSLCGASLVKEPQMFKHKEGATSLVVVQPDGKTDYAAIRKRYRALVVTREWVLDSVASYKLQAFDGYLV
uniref:BRCT domain-containing protein n=1 Tax=Pyxicephalus adspersus TaxID=30357 RepID=A0AAV3AUV8_PYXAD|nr:TPA: hypothetical protein GDO54_008397 [Pyxicephalus adspersus]